jgi:hypothetical protein
MRHVLMDPAFPDLVGEWAAATEAEEWLDPGFLETLDDADIGDDLADAIVIAAALADISDTRAW